MFVLEIAHLYPRNIAKPTSVNETTLSFACALNLAHRNFVAFESSLWQQQTIRRLLT